MAKVWRGCCVEGLGDADTFRVECKQTQLASETVAMETRLLTNCFTFCVGCWYRRSKKEGIVTKILIGQNIMSEQWVKVCFVNDFSGGISW